MCSLRFQEGGGLSWGWLMIDVEARLELRSVGGSVGDGGWPGVGGLCWVVVAVTNGGSDSGLGFRWFGLW